MNPEISRRRKEIEELCRRYHILIHGYADVDDRLVWDIVEAKLPTLRREVEALLSEE